MYSNTYQREYARAIGDTSYDLSYHFKLLSENSRKNLTAKERSNLLVAESTLKKQVRLKILKLDAKKSVGILTQQAREEIAMIQKGNEKIEMN